MAQRLDPLAQSPLLRGMGDWIAAGRMPNSVLLSGPEGCGKEAAALALARLLLGATEGPAAAKFDRLAHPDLLYVFPVESSLSIETYRELLDAKAEEPLRAVAQPSSAQIPIGSGDTPHPAHIRSVRSFAGARPFEARGRVVILADAHRMNRAAANALLKTLEEPPAHTYLFLCTHQPHLLPATIPSRCSRVKLPHLSEELLAGHLQAAHSVPEQEAMRVATACSGNARRAFDLMDPVARELADWASSIIELLQGPSRAAVLKAAEAISKAQPPAGKGKKLVADAGLSASRDVAMRVLDFLIADLLQLQKVHDGAELPAVLRSRHDGRTASPHSGRAARVLMAARADLARNVNVALVLSDAFAAARNVLLPGEAATSR